MNEELERVGLAARGQPAARPALGRPAAARGAGPGAGQPAQGPAAGRAPRRARPEAAQGPAGPAEADPARRRDHLRLRHPRPGGGADDVRPDRGHEPRPDRAGRQPRGGLRAAGDHLRRGLHRRLQPDAGRRQEGRRHRRGRAGQRRHGQSRGERLQRRRALLRGGAPREARDRAGRGAGEPDRRGPGGKLPVPGHRDPDDRATPRRGQDDRAGAERRRGGAAEAAGRGSEGKAVLGTRAHASRAREPYGGGGVETNKEEQT